MSSGVPIPKELWELIPPAAQAAVQGHLAGLHQELAALRAQVAELTARLGLNSQNSSKPPSSDGPQGKRRPPRESSGRKRGAQPGHELHRRPPLPPDHTETLKPTQCRRCGHLLAGTDPNPLCHQVLDLPILKPLVTQYQLHRLTCPCCGTSTCASLLAGVPSGQHGPRLQAVLALLAGGYRLSKRLVESLCGDLWGIDLCPGTVCKLEQQTTAATEPVVAPLRDHVRTRHANMDETSWREQGQRAWLWVVVTAGVTVFHIARSRGSAVARQLLGPGFQWVLTSDRYSAYQWLALRRRQLCWAHLIRDFQAMVDRQNAGTPVGQELLLFAEDVFTQWYRVRDGTIRLSTLRQFVQDQRPWLRDLLAKGSACACAKTAGVCRQLLRLEPALWTFTRLPGIEPTNNAAERALRHAVLWRRSSHGTDSQAGSRFVANILTIMATTRQQGRHVLEVLTACCQAHLQGKPAPSLLPLA